jgi:hypothetical protein
MGEAGNKQHHPRSKSHQQHDAQKENILCTVNIFQHEHEHPRSQMQSPSYNSKTKNNNKVNKMIDKISDGDAKLKSPTQSPGGAKSAYAKRTWSPHQANMNRRKKVDGDRSTLNDSFGQLSLADLNFGGDGDDDEEPDYLAMSLSSMQSSQSSLGGLKSSTSRGAGGGGRRRAGGRRPSGPSGGNSTTARTGTDPTSWKRSSTAAAQPPSSLSSSASSLLSPRSRVSSNKTKTKTSTTTATGDSSLKKLPTGGGGSGKRRSSFGNGSVSGQSVGSMISKTKTKQELMDEIPKYIKHKLYKISDPELSIKERVQLELDMMKTNPEEKRILLRFKRNFERKLFIDFRDEEQQNHTDKIQSDILIEQKKENQFLKTIEEKRKQERREERERLRREQQIEDDARTHKAKIISRDMTIIKDAALEAATISVERNQKEKQRQVKKDRKRMEDFRNGEGKTMMCDGQRALKEALIEQKVLPSTKSKSRLKQKNNRKKEEESNLKKIDKKKEQK